MSNGSGNGGGCAKAIGVILLIGVILTVLEAVWPALFVLAVAFFAAALVIRKNDADRARNDAEDAGEAQDDEEYYTKKCPSCGAQVKIPFSKGYAKCEYCRTVVQGPKQVDEVEEEEITPAKQQIGAFAICCIIAVVCAVGGLIGYGYSQQTGNQDGTSTSNTASEPASATSDSEASQPDPSETSADPSSNAASSSGDSSDPASGTETDIE